MKKNPVYLLAIVLAASIFSSFAAAQDERAISAAGNLYVISAKAGGVNYVDGKVSVAKKSGRTGYLLKGDTLEVGDKVSTGTNGKAEILLNPGSYIRLAENSGFEFRNTSLDDLQVKLTGGSAMFEIITDDEFEFVVSTPQSQFKILKSGIYRVDVLNDGSGKIAVWKGKAEIVDGKLTVVKGGREATVRNNQATIAKFDRDENDAFTSWSKTRAKELAKVNSRLERDNLRNSLLNSYNRNGWNLFNSYGLWVFDRYTGSYCFLPFGYGLSSPYGFGFGRDIWYFRLPRIIQTPPPGNTGGRDFRRKPPESGGFDNNDFRRNPVERKTDNFPAPKSHPSPRISPSDGGHRDLPGKVQPVKN